MGMQQIVIKAAAPDTDRLPVLWNAIPRGSMGGQSIIRCVIDSGVGCWQYAMLHTNGRVMLSCVCFRRHLSVVLLGEPVKFRVILGAVLLLVGIESLLADGNGFCGVCRVIPEVKAVPTNKKLHTAGRGPCRMQPYGNLEENFLYLFVIWQSRVRFP